MKAFVALAVICVLLPLVAGHGWVTDPKPRGYTGDQNGASQSGPCGAGTTYPQVVTLTTGDYLNVSWTIGGGHTGTTGPDTCRFSWSLTDNNATTFNNQILVDSIPCSAGNHYKYFAVNANSITSPSTAYLQFRWAAGDGGMWYNCVQMNISPIGVTIEDAEEGTQFGNTVQPTETVYYRIPADTNKHLYVKLSASADTQFSLSGGYLPSDASDAQSWVTAKANTDVGLSACSNEDSATTFYFAAYGGSSSITFSATAESYDAMLFPAYAAPQVEDSLPEGGSKFYWTEGYTEGNTYRRVYVQKTGGKGWVRLWKSLACTMDNTNTADESESSWGEHGACIDLGTTEGRKYIQVESLNGTDIDFELGVEEGQCEDKSFNGASAVQASFMLLVVAAVLAML